MQLAAKHLGTGRNRLFSILRKQGILSSGNIPYQRFIDAGYFRVIFRTKYICHNYESIPVTVVTHKGLSYIAKILERTHTKPLQTDGRFVL